MKPPSPKPQSLKQQSLRTIQRAKAHWKQSTSSSQQAKRLLNKDPIKSSFLSLQTAINALVAVVVLLGEHQLPMHSLTKLAYLLSKQPDFLPLLDELMPACTLLEEAGGLNPFQAQPANAQNQAEKFLQLSQQIRLITETWLKKQNFL